MDVKAGADGTLVSYFGERSMRTILTNGGKENERNFNETVTRSRCSFWTSDKKMEP